jgi:hypothetical protein
MLQHYYLDTQAGASTIPQPEQAVRRQGKWASEIRTLC